MAITRIGRVERGEKVIVKCISEPLQEEFEKVRELKDRYEDIQDEVKDFYEHSHGKTVPNELHKRIFIAQCDYEVATRLFWRHINENYNCFHIPCGIRDGYCLVRLKEECDESFNGLMKEFLRGFGGSK